MTFKVNDTNDTINDQELRNFEVGSDCTLDAILADLDNIEDFTQSVLALEIGASFTAEYFDGGQLTLTRIE